MKIIRYIKLLNYESRNKSYQSWVTKNFREKYVMRRDSNYLGANPPSTWDWASTKADGRDKAIPV
jgi:hypothetical protein